MKGREELEQAARAARAQMQDARDALTATRVAVSGGRAKSAKQAERQIVALRHALEADVTALRGRASDIDLTRAGSTRTVVTAGIAGLVALAGTGVALSQGFSRRGRRREADRQAIALAAALARQDRSATTSGGRRRGPGLLLVGAALAAGSAYAWRRRALGPVDPDDLWLPERDQDA